MPTALSIHAEQLHRDDVWARVSVIAQSMTRAGSAATFFTYPYRAAVEGREITDRIRRLADGGHEIGQHTHFYAPGSISQRPKQNDLSASNVDACLVRDFEAIGKAGLRPRGFSAGGWLFNDAVREGLLKLGFTYDCSTRGAAAEIAGSNPVSIPTTHSLREWFLSAGGRWPRTASRRCVVYLHDYDLLDARKYALLRAFLRWHGGGLARLGSLAEEIRPR